MTPLFLLRLQFGTAIGLHYIFPVLTIGLAFVVALFETIAFVKKDSGYRLISGYLVRLLAPVFIVGVATGLLMPFMFGTGWSRFSSVAGGILGSFLGIEAIVAFSMESVFLAVVLFGRRRVSARAYLAATYLLLIGSHLSAFFIVSANSWLQSPSGFAVENGTLVLTSLSRAIFNPTAVVRFLHVVLACWISGATLSCFLAARALHADRASVAARRMLAVGVVILAALPVVQLLAGHSHILDVLKYQPQKSPAYEGIFVTRSCAPLYIAGIPDAKHGRIRFGIAIPGLLSFLDSYNFAAPVKGLDDFPRDQWPNVDVLFTTFHLMVGIGFVLIGAGLLGGFLLWRKRLFDARWYLATFPFLVPLPIIASELGWIGSEIGRQPWTVWGVLRTAQASTPSLAAGPIAGAMAALAVVYATLFIALFFVVRSVLRRGFGE